MNRSAVRSNVLLDAGDPAVSLVLAESWAVGSPASQRAAVLAWGAAWEQLGWPAGLLSATVLVGSDGLSVLHMSRWQDEASGRAFARVADGPWAAAVDAATPGAVRELVVPYRVVGQARGSRSGGYPRGDCVGGMPGPGCVVIVDIATESHERAIDWVESMLRLGPVDTARTGLRSATFHLSVDGTKILNLAEWVDEDSHVAATTRQKEPDEAALVTATPGVNALSYRRFRWWATCQPE